MSDDEQKMIEANAKLVKDDNTEVACAEHGITRRWGELTSIAQLAVLAGLDVHGETCIMDSK